MHDSDHTWRLESLIGSRVLLGAGLLSLLTGTVFFVKLSNDHQWIPPQVRILCGIVAGLVLMLGGAWRLGKERTLIAEGLTGLGASVLFLSLWGAFGPFHLVHYGVAFAAMVAVSAALALVAWARKSQNVALAGLAGGYLTPFLLHSGSFDRVGLAVYLAVMSGAMLLLAVRCRYRVVEAASFGAALLYAPVFAPSSVPGDLWTSAQSLTVASVLFAEFALALFAAARRDDRVDPQRLVLLGAEVLAYAGVLELELRWNGPSLALADAGLAAVLLLAVATRVPAAMRVAYAWFGIGMLTRALEAWGGGHALTGTIAVEGAALIITGLRTERTWMRDAGYALLGTSVIGAVVHLRGDTETQAVFNLRTFALGAVVLSLAAVLRELRRYAEVLRRRERDLGSVALCIATALGLGAITADVVTATAPAGDWNSLTQTAMSVAWTIAASILVALGFRARIALARWLGIGVFAATIAKLFMFDLTGLDVMQRVTAALVLGALLVAVAGIYQVVMLHGRRTA